MKENPNHLIGECPKLLRNYNQRAFIGGTWSDIDEDKEERTKDENCLMAKASNEKLYKGDKKWIDDFKPIDDDTQQQAESTKNRPTADFEEESSKKQKLEEDNDAEKEELRDSMDVVPRDDVAIDVESLATKYPIVD
ncbi:hypothetical protein Tco_1575416 [Tanacetum coccineum]